MILLAKSVCTLVNIMYFDNMIKRFDVIPAALLSSK